MMTIDFETFSKAGYVGPELKAPRGATRAGLFAVNAHIYAEHPSTRILWLAYNFHDGTPTRKWFEGDTAPTELFERIKAGEHVEAHNVLFEFWLWNLCGVKKYGWPSLSINQIEDSMAKCAANGVPLALGKAAAALGVEQQKDKAGTALINLFSTPKPRVVEMWEEPEKAMQFGDYCEQDVNAEMDVSAALPNLNPIENELFTTCLTINDRGVKIDLPAVDACIALVDRSVGIGTERLHELTGGEVAGIKATAQLTTWLNANGCDVRDVRSETIDKALDDDTLRPDVREVLEIRSVLGGSATSKLFAMRRLASADGRVRGMYQYHGAHTGRWAGRGIQTQNFPRGNVKDVDGEIARILAGETRPLSSVTGCLRGMLIAADGHDLVSSDYSAIEAVVLAELAGESWRQEVFKTHGKIYEMSASKISGVPFDDIVNHKKLTGNDHPLRKTIGKVAELASGYGGGLGSWRAFGADKFMGEPEIQDAVKRWRADSPAIVSFWYNMERAFKTCITHGGSVTVGKYIQVTRIGRDVKIILPSGRMLTYRNARIQKVVKSPTWTTDAIIFDGRLPTGGGYGSLDTYGGRLVENVTQAVARDLLAFALVELERKNYPVVLHIHDEVVCEVPEGSGSIEELESIMSTMPHWAREWPVSASGGWRGKRFRKD